MMFIENINRVKPAVFFLIGDYLFRKLMNTNLFVLIK